jgi:hypothetical protein
MAFWDGDEGSWSMPGWLETVLVWLVVARGWLRGRL